MGAFHALFQHCTFDNPQFKAGLVFLLIAALCLAFYLLDKEFERGRDAAFASKQAEQAPVLGKH